MGIRGMHYFMTKIVPNGVTDIYMKREIDEYKRKNNGEAPTVVVDLSNLDQKFYSNNHEILLGGRAHLYADRVKAVLEKFQSIGANLVFFFDGPLQSNKIKTNINKKNKSYDESVKVFDAIYQGKNLSKNFENFYLRQAAQFFSVLISTARQFGEVHIAISNECDFELAKYATEHDALAIMSNDGDFLIFKGNWQLWSLDIDFSLMKTKRFNKINLRNELQLSSDQMPIFATLAGNDIVEFDMLYQYRRSISKKKGSHFYGIAEHVKKISSNYRRITPEDLQRLSRLALPTCHIVKGIALIQASLDSYDYSKYVPRTKDKLLREAESSKFNYIILANIPFVIDIYLFDLRKDDLLPFYTLLSPLLRRIMGILLRNVEGDVTRTFYCKTEHNAKYEKFIEWPQYPEGSFPVFSELISKPYGNDTHLDNIKFQLLCWQISSKLNSNEIQKLPEENLMNILCLFYLCDNGQITKDEADCILLACMSHGKNTPEIDVQTIDGRNARIAFLFSTFRQYIKCAICAVGLKDEKICAYPTFDGLHFHHIRQASRLSDFQMKFLREHNNLRIYKELKNNLNPCTIKK